MRCDGKHLRVGRTNHNLFIIVLSMTSLMFTLFWTIHFYLKRVYNIKNVHKKKAKDNFTAINAYNHQILKGSKTSDIFQQRRNQLTVFITDWFFADVTPYYHYLSDIFSIFIHYIFILY